MEAKAAHCALLLSELTKLKAQAKDKKAVEKLMAKGAEVATDLEKLTNGIEAFMSEAGDAIIKINDGAL